MKFRPDLRRKIVRARVYNHVRRAQAGHLTRLQPAT